MIGGAAASGRIRAYFAFALLFALCARALVPAGYMPTHGTTGLVISLCTGNGAKQTILTIPQSHAGDHGDDQPHKQPQPCAFTAFAAPVLASADMVVPSALGILLREIALPPPLVANLASFAHIRPPQRGPPPIA